jgi:hypothetical protein
MKISEKRMSQLIAAIRELAADEYPAVLPGADCYAGPRNRQFYATVSATERWVGLSSRGKYRKYDLRSGP